MARWSDVEAQAPEPSEPPAHPQAYSPWAKIRRASTAQSASRPMSGVAARAPGTLVTSAALILFLAFVSMASARILRVEPSPLRRRPALGEAEG